MAKSLQSPRSDAPVGLAMIGPTPPLLEALLEARKQTRDWLRSDHFAKAVEDMCRLASRFPGRSVHGVSDSGQALAGAMAYASADLELWMPPYPTPVLLVDGFIVGTAGLSIAAKHARAIGAQSVDAIILGLWGPMDSDCDAVDQLASLGSPVSLAA